MKSKFAENLRKYRLEKAMTQKQIAKLLNIDRTTYTKYETAVTEPSFDMPYKIVKIFNVSFDDLFYTNAC